MQKKEIYLQLLNDRLNEIDQRSFDLNAWKKSTALAVESCFGSNSPQLRAIQNINYEYNSWVLRDESGVTDPVKTNCKSVLNVIIKELEMTEDIVTESETLNNLQFVWLPFEDQLTGAASKQLKAILRNTNVSEEEVEKFLKNMPAQTPIDILKAILTSTEFKEWLMNK